MTIKPSYLVTDMNFSAIDPDGMTREVRSESAAIKKAKDVLVSANGDEVWIWKLSHVVSVSEPDVEKVK